jgi:hypothetical protein
MSLTSGDATECGFARERKPDLLHRPFDIHAAVAAEPA